MSYKRIERSLKNIIMKSENCENYKNTQKSFTRNRKMNFKDYVWYLIFQKGRTASMELDEYLKQKNNSYKISISKQAFSKQRLNMKPTIFIDLYKDYLNDFYANSKDEVKTYKGYHVLAVDGSIFEIPNTKELRELFKTQKNSSGHRESARARVSGIYDIENEFIIDATITDCEQGEKNLAKKNVTEAGKIIDLTKSIIIFDRGYPGIDLIWFLEKIGAKYIFRLQSTNMYEKEKRHMITNDEWLKLDVCGDRLRKIEDEAIKKELKEIKNISVRFTKVILDTGEIEYLLSNISETIISENEMKSVYFKRWQIEIGYDILKNKLHIENFTGKTKITIEQDFYAQIYVFNLLQDIKHDANEKIQKKHEDKNLKYEYKPNVNLLAGWLKNILIAMIFVKGKKKKSELYNIILEKAEKNLVAINPNRSYTRKAYTSGRNKYSTNIRYNM